MTNIDFLVLVTLGVKVFTGLVESMTAAVVVVAPVVIPIILVVVGNILVSAGDAGTLKPLLDWDANRRQCVPWLSGLVVRVVSGGRVGCVISTGVPVLVPSVVCL